MEGELKDVLYYLDQFGREFIVIEVTLIVITLFLLFSLWIYNKKRFQQLQHSIPARVVKTHLDAIIQNSNAFKSALFRGSGHELDPSVLSLNSLHGGESLDLDRSGKPNLELARKEAELSALKTQLAERTDIISQLEKALADGSGQSGGDAHELASVNGKLINANTEIAQLKKDLQALQSKGASVGGSGDLEKVQKERDTLKEKLQEYEIIEDDLANLKRLQQENEQLKRSLAGAGGAAPAAEPAADTVAEIPPESAAQPEPESEVESQTEEITSETPASGPEPIPPAEDEQPPKESKTPEDLLSEFEKMLG